MNRRSFIIKATIGLLSIPLVSKIRIDNNPNNRKKQNINIKNSNKDILQYARSVKVPEAYWHQYEGKNFTKLG